MKTLAFALMLASSHFAVAQSEVADAAMQRNNDVVTKLVKDGADVNGSQPDGATALMWAAYNGDVKLAQALLKAGANPSAANRNGSTALWLAATRGDAEMLETLLDAGANANEELPLGRRPLMLAARSGVVDAVNVLLKHGADPNAKETQRGTTALMQAADQGHAAVAALLIKEGADVAAVSSAVMRDGRTAALGQADDPRVEVRRQTILSVCERPTPDLDVLRSLVADGSTDVMSKDKVLVDFVASGAEQTTEAICSKFVRAGIGFAQVAGGGSERRSAGGGAPREPDGGELTALVYASRTGDIETAQALLDGGADINQTTRYGWSPLLAATQNQNYLMGKFLIEHGADVNLANKGAWTPLYLATDNRNIEGGDYPTRKADMDALAFITLLLDKGADVNARVTESTETRTVFTNQWLDENGATAFLRASQSGDLPLMKLLLDHGADPKINTELNISPLAVAAGVGWVEGVTKEWSTKQTVEAVKLLLSLGIDPNLQAATGRTALHGAAHKGATDVVKVLVEAGAKMDTRDYGNTDNRGSPELAAHTWEAIDYADGLVRVGVQSAIPHPETAAVLRDLMKKAGLETPPEGRTLDSICIVEVCSVNYDPNKG
jgi:ankyrin repeat protein